MKTEHIRRFALSWACYSCIMLLLCLVAPISPVLADDAVLKHVAKRDRASVELANKIWNLAELGYTEDRSSEMLQQYLHSQGFRIKSSVASIPTAFVATAGSGKPVIGILAEFDALPGMSQQAKPERAPIVAQEAGHACGHHLFGAASATAGVALADWLRQSNTAGTIKVFGTPAEEGGSGKVYMARAGLFDDVDVVLHWHPSDANSAAPSTTTANKSGRFTFRGKAAHAAASPDKGRSALDGVEAMNFMVNLMREHIPQMSRIHYIITNGGDAPNIVPAEAQVYYYVRHPEAQNVIELFERVATAARAAALGTGTKVDVEVMHGNHSVLPNHALSGIIHKHLHKLGGVTYDSRERRFAETLRKTLVSPDMPLGSEQNIQPFRFYQSMGSTDVGDVSWLVPTAGFSTATWVPGTSAHSWQAVAAGGMSIGHKGMLLATRVLALSATDLFLNPEHIRVARAEFKKARGSDFHYTALLGDRNPPLDYRK